MRPESQSQSWFFPLQHMTFPGSTSHYFCVLIRLLGTLISPFLQMASLQTLPFISAGVSSSPGSANMGPSSLLGGSCPSPNSPNPALTVISVPRAQCEGSRREGWLPGQRRIKPLLCQSADWLRHVPPPAILRVGGRGKGLGWAGRGTSVPCQHRTAPSWSVRAPGPERLSLPRGTLASPFLCLQLPWRLQMAVSLGTAAATESAGRR